MTEAPKPAPHPAAANNPVHQTGVKAATNHQPMAKKAKKAAPKPKALPPAIPSVTVPLGPAPQSKGAIAGAVAVTLGAGVLIGHAVSRMIFRR